MIIFAKVRTYSRTFKSQCSISRYFPWVDGTFSPLIFPYYFAPTSRYFLYSIAPLLNDTQDLSWLKYGARNFDFQCTFSHWDQINFEVYCPFRETDSKRNLSSPEEMCNPVWDPGKNQSWPQVPALDKGRIGVEGENARKVFGWFKNYMTWN